MIKFIKLTDAFNGNEVIVNTNAIAYMKQDQSKNTTVIYFISALNTERSCCLACVVVKETINEIQKSIYLN